MTRVYVSALMDYRGRQVLWRRWAEWQVPPDQEADAIFRVEGTFRTFFDCVSQRFGKRPA